MTTVVQGMQKTPSPGQKEFWPFSKNGVDCTISPLQSDFYVRHHII